MTDAALEAVLRRDRTIVATALFVLAALAWAYVLWLAADMDMGDMDMSGFRTIPAGTALMMPANVPWNATEFAFIFAMWAVMMVGMMTSSATPMILVSRGPLRGTTGQAIRRELLVCKRLSSCLDRFCSRHDVCAVDAGTREFAYADHGSRERDPKRHHADCS